MNSGLCVRRVRRADFFTAINHSSPAHPRTGILPGVSTYRTVQNPAATSLADDHAARSPPYSIAIFQSLILCLGQILTSCATSPAVQGGEG